MGVVLGGWQFHNMSSKWSAGTGTCLLVEEPLEEGASRTVGHKMAFFTTEEAARWAAVWLTAGRAVEGHFFAIVVVDVACRSGRWGLGGRSDC